MENECQVGIPDYLPAGVHLLPKKYATVVIFAETESTIKRFT